MKQQNRPIDQRRRKFLGSAASVGLGVAAVATVPATASAAGETAQPEQEQGYRLSQHVLDYYKSAAK